MGHSGDRSGRSMSSLSGDSDEGRDGDRTPRQSPRMQEPPDFPETPVESPRSSRRPTLGSRSATTGDTPRRTTLRRTKTSRQEEREWSVFGQLMQDDGRLRSPGSSQRIKKRISRPNVLSGTFSAATMTSRPESLVEERDTRTSIVQSPVQESFPQDDPTYTNASEYDSDDYESLESAESELPASDEKKSRWPSLPTVPILYRNILKCAVAYFVASLFTFVPALSHLIGSISSNGESKPSPSGHMVATVAVYFNPAKTAGAMLEADLYCLLGLAWASFISLGSMGMFWWIDVIPGWEWLADVVAMVWIGLGMTAVAFMKVWMAKPSFNTACSMTTIILFVVVVKEGGLETLLQVACIIITGSLVSNVVCYLLWPQTAAAGLRNSMTRTLDSFETLLTLLTRTFLLEEQDGERGTSQGRLQRAIDNHQATFTLLQRSLAEARAEWALHAGGTASIYEDAVGCMQRLAQHLNGLRGGTRLQLELAQAARNGRIVLRGSSEAGSVATKGKDVDGGASGKDEDAANLQAAAEIFGELVDDMGPPLNALSYCTYEECVQKHVAQATTSFRREAALGNEYERTTDVLPAFGGHRAVMHGHDRFSESATSLVLKDDEDHENALLTRSDADETVFLVYFFIFTLQEFAKELTSLVDAMNRIYALEHMSRSRSLWSRCVHFFSFSQWRARLKPHAETKERPTLKRRFSSFITPHTQRRPAVFPKVRPHAPNTVLTPARTELTRFGRVGQALWRLGGILKRPNAKFAFKAGMATAILAAPAFFDRTRPIFVEYRGEWALISVLYISFSLSYRLLLERLGALTAACIFTIFPENPIALSIFGFFYSIPCFYYIVSKPQLASSGSYNIRQRDVPVFEIAYFRSMSVIIGVVYAGLVSRIWWPAEARRELGNALSELRKPFKSSLVYITLLIIKHVFISRFCLNIGWLYTHLVAANSGIPVTLTFSQTDLKGDAQDALNGVERSALSQNGATSIVDISTSETSLLLPKSVSMKLNDSIRTFMAMELHLQIKLLELQGLLAQTQHEPRLKGPFPVKMYRSILTSLQTILDKLHSMRCVTTREEWFTSVRQDFVLPVNRERREMVGNIILYFSVLSGAFKLKAPLPPYLPPAEKSRQRLVEAIQRLDIVRNRDVKGSRQLLFFAYALTMKGVIQELDYLGKTLQGAFGVIGQTTEEFEELFGPGVRDTLQTERDKLV
ncbi:hypothetical protein EW145_g6738 [Phellinidium pouzarii]|uniref:DUF2421 domain-containing protein n=1 Tax=Phellinidium pouzarii TaxID=167371 RepID=A0A4S4KZI0_9AGAM|nr:hypothetical protein EW145_g6738 [Phellinidium pouzarii]